ncbi:SDR family oxidoreductase [Pseudonocardia sp. CA-107938]|uniref:SDR family oxidoreductase n=1 Tax=Pseudonocardia sp. CA-107938 TaxID=3240021 RepID=UPI003D8BEC74
MTGEPADRPVVVVLGARNLGGAVLRHFVEQGWRGAAIARTEDTLEQVRASRALGVAADVTDPLQLRTALEHVRQVLGRLDALVNAAGVGIPKPGEQYGGGQIADADLGSWERWADAIGRQAFVFLSEGARALRAGGGGALVQIGNGLALRPKMGEGLWAAGQQAARSLVHAAAEELRHDGVRVATVLVDALVDSPKLEALRADPPKIAAGAPYLPDHEALADMGAIAEAVHFAATRDPRGLVVELVVTAAGRPPVPR